MSCRNCHRHASNHPELFDLLTQDHQSALQAMLCDDHEGGSCPHDPDGHVFDYSE